MAAAAIWRFVFRVLAWLPVCFLFWYGVSNQIAWPLAHASHALAQIMQPGVIQDVEIHGETLTYITTLTVRAEDGRKGLLAPEVNTMTYTFGCALFLALMLAAGAEWWKMAAGIVMLLPFQAWGVTFDALAQSVRASPYFVGTVGLASANFDLIAAGYQFGSLVFPTGAPVLAWVLFSRQYIDALITKGACAPIEAPVPTAASSTNGPLPSAKVPAMAAKPEK